MDREQALNGQQKNGNSADVAKETIEKPQRKGGIDTGRSGGIGNAINIFNKAQENETVAPVQRVNKYLCSFYTLNKCSSFSLFLYRKNRLNFQKNQFK